MVVGCPRKSLANRDQGQARAAALVLRAHRCDRALGDSSARSTVGAAGFEKVEVDVEAVGEHQGRAPS